jgi:SAM-dependent methyltransferase
MAELNRERRHWEDLASFDPMWVILTEPGREGRWTPEDFFQSGRDEIDQLLTRLPSMGISVHPGVALDFGCGLGRLTQALCERFGRVYGIDISETMIAGAKSHNRHGDRAMYHANAVDQLPMVPTGTVDFVYSRLVLQHIPRAAQEKYMPPPWSECTSWTATPSKVWQTRRAGCATLTNCRVGPPSRKTSA